jgi:hypothetical protein
MKKIDLSQTFHIIANVGVIGGILLLAFELRQNNELMAAEARFNRLTMVVDAWRFRAEHGELYELRERANNNEALSRSEQMRVDASVMAVFVMLDWTFRELSDDTHEISQVRQVKQYNIANEASNGRDWETRKNSFDPAFVQWMEENVIKP